MKFIALKYIEQKTKHKISPIFYLNNTSIQGSHNVEVIKIKFSDTFHNVFENEKIRFCHDSFLSGFKNY